MRLLPGSERARSSGDFGTIDSSALGEEPPGLLLHGHAPEPGPEAQALGNLVVQVSNQHASHEPILVRRIDIVKRYRLRS
jgi:hypothetical protein